MGKKNLTDDLKISSTKELITPKELISKLPMSKTAVETVVRARNEIINILDGTAKRLLLIVGPCSIHDVESAADYAGRLLKVKKEVEKRNNFKPLINRTRKIPYLVDQHLLEKDAQIKN